MANWLTVNPTSGAAGQSVAVTLTPIGANTGRLSRSANLKVKVGSEVIKTIPVVQSGKTEFLSLEEDTFTTSTSAKQIDIQYTANTGCIKLNWDYSNVTNCEYLYCVYGSGETPSFIGKVAGMEMSVSNAGTITASLIKDVKTLLNISLAEANAFVKGDAKIFIFDITDYDSSGEGSCSFSGILWQELEMNNRGNSYSNVSNAQNFFERCVIYKLYMYDTLETGTTYCPVVNIDDSAGQYSEYTVSMSNLKFTNPLMDTSVNQTLITITSYTNSLLEVPITVTFEAPTATSSVDNVNMSGTDTSSEITITGSENWTLDSSDQTDIPNTIENEVLDSSEEALDA